MTREELRDAAVQAFQKWNNIAIQAATGVGKSKIAIDICNECATRQLQSLKVLLVVAELAHINNWKKEFDKWGYDYSYTTIICYASLKNFKNTIWDLVIFDEAHHLDSELRLEVFDCLKTKYRVFLSATLKDSLLWRLQDSCGYIKNIKMGLQEAFTSGVLPEPEIRLIPLVLDNTKPTETIVEEWGKKDKRVTAICTYEERWKYIRDRKKIPNGRLIITCTQKQKYDYITEQFEFYKKRFMTTRNEIIKNKWLQYGSKRKTYIGTLKTSVAQKLIEKVKDKRLICFCTNIEQADLLGGENAIHSKKKDRPGIIQKFNDKKINSLFAVGMLQEGVNLEDIQVGIIIQLDGEERPFIQRFGRALRAETPVQYIIYYKGTRDEEYLKTALENIDKKYIKEINKDDYFD